MQNLTCSAGAALIRDQSAWGTALCLKHLAVLKSLITCIFLCVTDWHCPGASSWSCRRTWSWEGSWKRSASWCPHATGTSRISWSCQRSGRTIPTGEMLWFSRRKDLTLDYCILKRFPSLGSGVVQVIVLGKSSPKIDLLTKVLGVAGCIADSCMSVDCALIGNGLKKVKLPA